MVAIATTRIPTSSAEMAMPPGRHTSVPNTDGNCCGVAPNSTRRYSRMARPSPMVAMTRGMSSPPGSEQATDERRVEDVAEQQDRDRDRDDGGEHDPDLGEWSQQLGAPDQRGPVGHADRRFLLAQDQDDHRRQNDELAVGEVDGAGGLPQQREPHRGESVDRSCRQPRQADLDERRHGVYARPPTSAGGPHPLRATLTSRFASNRDRRDCRVVGPWRRSDRPHRRPRRCSSHGRCRRFRRSSRRAEHRARRRR